MGQTVPLIFPWLAPIFFVKSRLEGHSFESSHCFVLEAIPVMNTTFSKIVLQYLCLHSMFKKFL
jgi:hypothetical protein